MVFPSFLAGVALALSLAAPPGPANMLMVQAVARRGFVAGWWTGVGAIAADFTMLMLTAFGVIRLLERAPWVHVGLGLFGAGLMAYFALGAWRAARSTLDAAAMDAGARSGFFQGYLLIITSPFNLAWWLTAGTLLISQAGWFAVAGFFAGLMLWVAGWSYLAGEGKRRVARFSHYVAYGASGALALFAVLVLVASVQKGLALLA